MTSRCAACVTMLVCLLPAQVSAADTASGAVVHEAKPRRFHGAVGAGWSWSAGDPDGGGYAHVDLYPGGRWGQWGARLAVRSFGNVFGDAFQDKRRGSVMGHILFELGGARPQLQLAAHLGAGASLPLEHIITSTGFQIQVGLIGPLALGIDTEVQLTVASNALDLALFETLTLRTGW